MGSSTGGDFAVVAWEHSKPHDCKFHDSGEPGEMAFEFTTDEDIDVSRPGSSTSMWSGLTNAFVGAYQMVLGQPSDNMDEEDESISEYSDDTAEVGNVEFTSDTDIEISYPKRRNPQSLGALLVVGILAVSAHKFVGTPFASSKASAPSIVCSPRCELTFICNATQLDPPATSISTASTIPAIGLIQLQPIGNSTQTKLVRSSVPAIIDIIHTRHGELTFAGNLTYCKPTVKSVKNSTTFDLARSTVPAIVRPPVQDAQKSSSSNAFTIWLFVGSLAFVSQLVVKMIRRRAIKPSDNHDDGYYPPDNDDDDGNDNKSADGTAGIPGPRLNVPPVVHLPPRINRPVVRPTRTQPPALRRSARIRALAQAQPRRSLRIMDRPRVSYTGMC